MMELVETIVSRAAVAANGTTEIEVAGRSTSQPPWRRATMAELIAEHAGETMHPRCRSRTRARSATGSGIVYEDGWGPGRADGRGRRRDRPSTR